MKRDRYLAVVSLFMFTGITLLGCASEKESILNQEFPTAITVWHSYNAFAKSKFDEKVTAFNETVGMEKGIVVDAYGYGSEEELNEALFNSANQMIGSDPMPDIGLLYPDSACRFDELVPLVELEKYFSEEELGRYRMEFLEEGAWGDPKVPKLLPVSKSTELLYLNETDWDIFSAETGASKTDLETWEGLVRIAEQYYTWSGGNAFMGMNSYHNFAILTAAQLGEEPFVEDDGRMEFRYSEQTAQKVWENYYIPHLKGWYQSNVYNQDGIKSGNLLAYIGSSAGAGYFPDEVIEDENKSYPIECCILPYPTFEGAPVYMTQRGAGMGIFTTDTLHESASAEFLKWFTKPEQNLEFTGAIGYMPVEKEALESIPELIKNVQNQDNSDAVKKSVIVSVEMMEQGKFYIKKTFPHSYEADLLFGESLDEKIAMDLDELQVRVQNGAARDLVIEELSGEENFHSWYSNLIEEMAGKLNE